jgi:formylglycine-generating enzyme required for sulfatase activity
MGVFRSGGAPSYQTFHFGNSLSFRQANFDWRYPYGGGEKKDDKSKSTCKVGSYPANGFGLHDMHGNVWEWCSDWYDDYYGKSPRRDPPGPPKGRLRVFRGGNWGGHSLNCRSALRGRLQPGNRYDSLGFRVALVASGR